MGTTLCAQQLYMRCLQATSCDSCQEPVMVETHVKEKLSEDDVTVRPMKVLVVLSQHLLAYLFGPLGMVIRDVASKRY